MAADDQRAKGALFGLWERVASWARLDLSPGTRPPRLGAAVVAALVSLAGSLAADAALVAIGTAVFPSTKGYVHFAFGDYGKLTVIGVLIACVGWPVVARVTSAPRRLFLRLAVAATAVLYLPDVWLLLRTQPPRAVAVLMSMHLAIAVVTYNALVRIAPVRAPRRDPRGAQPGPSAPGSPVTVPVDPV